MYPLKSAAVGLTAALALVACSAEGNGTGSGTGGPSVRSAPPSSATAAVRTDGKAADLRTRLNYLLGEHLILASKSTAAALGGRSAEFAAYRALLNTNGTDIGAVIGAAYGADTQNRFNAIWSAHDGFFVDYATGVAMGDRAIQEKAVSDLTTLYTPQFSDLIAGATGLPKEIVTELITTHVLTTKAIVDAQGARDWPGTYAAIRKGYALMRMIGDPLSSAIAKKTSATLPADASNKGVDLRVSLNLLLEEHLYLVSDTTGAALGGRSDESKAAGDALDANGTDLGARLGSLYGADTQNRFNAIWRAHNGFFVDYSTGVATKDQAKMTKAVEDLTTVYIPQFSDFIAGVTGLSESAVADPIRTHVLTTKAVVDAQGANDFTAAAAADRNGAQHMEMVGGPLAAAIVARLPQKFAT